MSGEILVLGATGKTGGAVVRGLRALGLPVRTAARKGADVVFDWSDSATHADALRGAAGIYLVAPPLESDPVSVMIPLVERAISLGARRFVLLSSSAVEDGDPGLGMVERGLRERAPEWTIVKPSWFMQNFIGRSHPHGASLLDHDVVVTSTGSGRVGFVDVEDIASVAVRALADAVSHDTAHVVTGPQAISYGDLAEILSRAVGRRFRHVHVDDDTAKRRLLDAQLPEPVADLLVGLDARIRDGAEARTTDTVLRVTGRPPRSFEDFARANAASFTR